MPHIALADGEGVYEFWMSTTVPGGVTKDSMMKIEKDAAKNANFPGFKKGQIPPWAKPQLKVSAGANERTNERASERTDGRTNN